MRTLATSPNAENGYTMTPFETREKPLFHHLHGLSYTATGYGRKIPTVYQVKDGNRWKRVYVCCYSNTGTAYFLRGEKWVTVDYLN